MKGMKILTLMCMLLMSISIHAEDRALLIGIGDYNGDGDYNDIYPNGNDLGGINIDINLMKKVVKSLGFQKVKVLMDTTATLEGIKEALGGLSSVDSVDSGDRVLIYFSGHGYWVPDDGTDELDGKDEVLVTQDVRENDNGDLVNVLRDDEFGALLAKIPSQNIYVLIDACHSGTTTRAWNSTTDIVHAKIWKRISSKSRKGTRSFGDITYTSSKGGFADTKGIRIEPTSETEVKAKYVVLSAAQDDEQAVASETGSYFTRGISKAIQGLHSNNETVTMSKLKESTTAYIEKYLLLEKPDYKIHKPNLIDDYALKNRDMRGTLWQVLESRVDSIPQQIEITTNRSTYGVADSIIITCQINMDGYINVVSVDSDDDGLVIYPNEYHPNNSVEKNTTITIPPRGAKFSLKAAKPLGKNLIAVLVSKKPFNASEIDGIVVGPYKALDRESAKKSLEKIGRGIVIESGESPSWQAGKTIINVVE